MSVAEIARPRRRRRHLRWLLLFAGVALAWALFKMFEPVLTWSSGWQPLPAAAAATPQVDAFDPAWAKLASAASAELGSARARLQAPALSAAIMIDGRRVWASAAGYAELEPARPVALDSSFRLGSSSKALNALAMARLIDAGKLDIERPVRSYVTDLPETYAQISTRQAISHTAGIPDYGLCLCFPIWEHRNRRHFDGVRDALRVFEDEPLLFAPGTGFKYSSYGANVAGAVVEAAAGQSYLSWLNEGVFKPLRMHHSGGDIAGQANARQVAFYEVREGKYKPADPIDNSLRYPSGGLVSTPSDMLAAGNAFLDDSLLSAGTRKLMLTPQALSDGRENPQGYALGIRVSGDKKLFDDRVRTTIYSHHGTGVGSTSYFAVYPEYGLVVSVMMNKGQESLDALAPEVTRLVEPFIAERIRQRRALALDY